MTIHALIELVEDAECDLVYQSQDTWMETAAQGNPEEHLPGDASSQNAQQ